MLLRRKKLGENCLVNVVEEWETLEELGEFHSRGFYQVLSENKNTEIRVAVGGFGFRKEFKAQDDALLNHIQVFCKSQKYIKVTENVRDEDFFE